MESYRCPECKIVLDIYGRCGGCQKLLCRCQCYGCSVCTYCRGESKCMMCSKYTCSLGVDFSRCNRCDVRVGHNCSKYCCKKPWCPACYKDHCRECSMCKKKYSCSFLTNCTNCNTEICKQCPIKACCQHLCSTCNTKLLCKCGMITCPKGCTTFRQHKTYLNRCYVCSKYHHNQNYYIECDIQGCY